MSTQGPWKTSCRLGGPTDLKHFTTITDLQNRHLIALADSESSAALIAAAPELLAWTKEFLAHLVLMHPDTMLGAKKHLRGLINRAEGPSDNDFYEQFEDTGRNNWRIDGPGY